MLLLGLLDLFLLSLGFLLSREDLYPVNVYVFVRGIESYPQILLPVLSVK